MSVIDCLIYLCHLHTADLHSFVDLRLLTLAEIHHAMAYHSSGLNIVDVLQSCGKRRRKRSLNRFSPSDALDQFRPLLFDGPSIPQRMPKTAEESLVVKGSTHFVYRRCRFRQVSSLPSSSDHVDRPQPPSDPTSTIFSNTTNRSRVSVCMRRLSFIHNN